MVINATFNNISVISWQSVLLLEETRVPEINTDLPQVTDSDKVYQLLAHGRWFSPGTPASSTTKTDRHDIAEILLKVALNTINKSINQSILDNKSIVACPTIFF
jgi:hypothetical protein